MLYECVCVCVCVCARVCVCVACDTVLSGHRVSGGVLVWTSGGEPFNVVVVSLPCWRLRHVSNRREKSFLFLFACLIELASPAPLGCQCLDQFDGQSRSIKHKFSKKEKKVDGFKDYLSMACVIVMSNGDILLFFSLSLSFFAPLLAWMGRKNSFRRTHILHWPQ